MFIVKLQDKTYGSFGSSKSIWVGTINKKIGMLTKKNCKTTLLSLTDGTRD
jgi:hypothetical protein